MPYTIDLNKYTGKLGGFLSMVLMSHAGVDNQVDADEFAKLEQAKNAWKNWGPSGPPVIDLDVQAFLIPFFQQSTGL